MLSRHAVGAFCLGVALLAAPARAVDAPRPASQTRDNGTLDITSDRDLEWLQQDKAYVARGNAVAKRGGLTLTGETLIAYYRNRVQTTPPPQPTPAAKPAQAGFDTGNTDIWRVVAQGNVHISSEGREAWSDRMDYDKDQAVVVLTGGALKAVTGTDTITARDSLEYWQNQDMGVARGDAKITKENGQTLAADLVGAHFEKDATGHSSLKTIQANGHVVITTATDIVHGDQGTYDLQSRRTVVFGNVRVTRGENVLEGESAEVNMDTGISQIFPGAGKRVHALFIQEKAQQQEKSQQAPAPAATNGSH